MRGSWQEISAEEFARIQDLYGPLAEAVRELVDPTVRSGAGKQAIAAATTAA
ncbi:MAG: PaaI family thioesterase, partial [Mycobacterium sp.]|nr:PaaI family thioesterase [Mycobacterium sp.]